MDECREAFEKWCNDVHDETAVCFGLTSLDYVIWQAAWTSRQTETIRHAFNAGVAWAIGNGKDIDEYLEAQK